MYFYLYLCCAMFITLAQSGNLTLPDNKKNSTDGPSDLPKTNITFVSEGGTLLPNTPALSSPKENLNILITLDEELSNSTGKAIVARKGVDMHADEKNSTKAKIETTGNLTPETTKKLLTPVLDESADSHVKTILPNNVSIGSNVNNNTKVPKKPLITSYEALANMEKQFQSDQSKIPVLPSTKTMASSQIPSPNQDTMKKVYPSKATNSHPGMVMPIVITILVVPMFAIVGYFALKRGQEAWKNRHYKRMDFLLDGMYND